MLMSSESLNLFLLGPVSDRAIGRGRYLIKSTYENGTVMYNAQQHSVTSSTWMVYGPYQAPIGFAEQKVTECLLQIQWYRSMLSSNTQTRELTDWNRPHLI